MIPLAEQVMAEIRRLLDLRAQGCTCTPGRLGGGPAKYAEDVLCPVHKPGSGDLRGQGMAREADAP